MERIPAALTEGVNRDLTTTMLETMATLKTENAELGGSLFGIFGKGDSEFFLFNTPLQRAISQPDGTSQTVNDFLVVTRGGFKLIRIDEGATASWYPYGGVKNLKEQLELYANYGQPTTTSPERSGFSYSAHYQRDYQGGSIIFPLDTFHHTRGLFKIEPHSTLFPGSEPTKSMRLVAEIDSKTVLEIVRLNQERIKEEVEKEAQTKKIMEAKIAEVREWMKQQEAKEAQAKTSPEVNIAAAHELMEALTTNPTEEVK